MTCIENIVTGIRGDVKRIAVAMSKDIVRKVILFAPFRRIIITITKIFRER